MQVRDLYIYSPHSRVPEISFQPFARKKTDNFLDQALVSAISTVSHGSAHEVGVSQVPIFVSGTRYAISVVFFVDLIRVELLYVYELLSFVYSHFSHVSSQILHEKQFPLVDKNFGWLQF